MNQYIILNNTIYKPQTVPSLVEPQVAVVGRSNVGKSSLINCLAANKKLARTSSTPGKTRSINLFWVPKKQFFLVDFPGYGYARRSKSEQTQWAHLVETYLGQNHLQSIIVLLDCRHPPQKNDLHLISYLTHYNPSIIPVLTKIDKCTLNKRSQSQRQWQEILGYEKKIIPFSARTQYGKQDLWQAICQTIET